MHGTTAACFAVFRAELTAPTGATLHALHIVAFNIAGIEAWAHYMSHNSVLANGVPLSARIKRLAVCWDTTRVETLGDQLS